MVWLEFQFVEELIDPSHTALTTCDMGQEAVLDYHLPFKLMIRLHSTEGTFYTQLKVLSGNVTGNVSE